MRLCFIAVSVIKFGDTMSTQNSAKSLEAAGLFINGYSENSFTLLTNLSALRNIAQTIKVDIGTTLNRQKSLVLNTMLFYIFF